MKPLNEYHSKIKERREKIGMSVEEVARKLGVARTTVYRYESAEIEKMPVSVLFDLANILRTNPFYLMGINCDEDITLQNMSEEELEEYERIRNKNIVKVYGKIAAGQPIEAIEEVIDEIVCPYTKFNSENLFALQVCGDSMNKIIQDGDYAIINKQPTVNDGEIAAVLIDGSDATLKKFYRLPDKIALYPLSTNSIHKPIEITEADNIKVNILGKFICGVTALQEN